ncbi:MAG: acyltransferase [Firmicutes bacterium]|nr:acyltransferase [Candidatus Colimorpha enterica]
MEEKITELNPTENPQNTHLRHRHIRPEIRKIRLLMIALCIIYTYGIHPAIGELGTLVLSFSVPVMFIISGFLVLRESPYMEERLIRTIKRTALCFGILFVSYLILSFITDWRLTLSLVASKAFWAELIVFNYCLLPTGAGLWFVQAMLYAYIIIFLLNKLKMLKYDVYIALFCLAVAFVFGDLSALIGFNLFGHTYLGGNFLTRALPYILIGSFIHKKNEFFTSLKIYQLFIVIIAGIALSMGEYYILKSNGVLSYVGHTLGTLLTATGISVIALNVKGIKVRSDVLKDRSRAELMIPYYVCSPVYAVLMIAIETFDANIMYYVYCYVSFITVIISYLFLFIYSAIRHHSSDGKEDNKRITDDVCDDVED